MDCFHQCSDTPVHKAKGGIIILKSQMAKYSSQHLSFLNPEKQEYLEKVTELGTITTLHLNHDSMGLKKTVWY